MPSRARLALACLALALAAIPAYRYYHYRAAHPTARDWHRTRMVMDMADIIDPDERMRISTQTAAIEKAGGPQIVVATERALDTDSLASDAIERGRTWGIGHAGNDDDGIVILIVQSRREARIEPGFAFHETLGDAECRRIEALMAQRLARDDWTGAARLGLDEVLARLPPPRAGAR